jgi:hypothetical protein
MASPVMQAIQAARLRELAEFMIWPAEEIAQTLALIGADPMKLQAAINLMTAEPGAERIALPRSWPKVDQSVWDALPPAIQLRVSDREYSRDRQVRMKQDETAALRREVSRLQALLAPAPEAANNNGAQQKEENGKAATTERVKVRAQGERAEIHQTEASR